MHKGRTMRILWRGISSRTFNWTVLRSTGPSPGLPLFQVHLAEVSSRLILLAKLEMKFKFIARPYPLRAQTNFPKAINMVLAERAAW